MLSPSTDTSNVDLQERGSGGQDDLSWYKPMRRKKSSSVSSNGSANGSVRRVSAGCADRQEYEMQVRKSSCDSPVIIKSIAKTDSDTDSVFVAPAISISETHSDTDLADNVPPSTNLLTDAHTNPNINPNNQNINPNHGTFTKNGSAVSYSPSYESNSSCHDVALPQYPNSNSCCSSTPLVTFTYESFDAPSSPSTQHSSHHLPRRSPSQPCGEAINENEEDPQKEANNLHNTNEEVSTYILRMQI